MKINRRGFMQAIVLGALVAPVVVSAEPVKYNNSVTYHRDGDKVVLRRDLADVIYDISPTETPFMKAFK